MAGARSAPPPSAAASDARAQARDRSPLAPVSIVVLVAGVPVTAEVPVESLEALRDALAPPARPVAASPYYSTREAAEVLRCNPRTIYGLIGDGRLTRHGTPKHALLLRAEVDALAAGEVTPC